MPFEGDFTGDMDPSLKKAFGERWEEKKISLQSNGSQLEKLNTPKFITGLDEKEKSSLCGDDGSRESSTKQSGCKVQKNLLIVVQNVFIERKTSGISWVIVCRTCIHTGRVFSVESNHSAHRLCGEANQGLANLAKSMACLMGVSIKFAQNKLRVNVPEVPVYHLPGSKDVTLRT